MRTLLSALLLCLPALCQPRFEVASIKACKPGEISPGVEAPNTGGKSASNGDISSRSPGRLTMNCTPLRELIRIAYIEYANGRRNTVVTIQPRVEGGPSWVLSERWAIAAKADGPASQSMMLGPMLQILLEDRFQLKIRRETREAPVFDLTARRAASR